MRKASLKRIRSKPARPFKKKPLSMPIPDVDDIPKIKQMPKIRPSESAKGNRMPWDAQGFQKHNKSLSESEAGQAAAQANAILANGGDEGVAIATANKQANLRRVGSKAKGERKAVKGLRRADSAPGTRVMQ